MNKFWNIIALILGAAEEVVPVFIHNPVSQKIEGVIVSTVNGTLQALANPPAPAPVAVQSKAA